MLKITIQTGADFTPKGKRSARVVATSRGGRVLRWYVGGRRYRALAANDANLKLSKDWMAAQ